MTRSSWEAALAGLAEPDREVAQLLLRAADLDHDGRLSFQGRASTGSSLQRPFQGRQRPSVQGGGRSEQVPTRICRAAAIRVGTSPGAAGRSGAGRPRPRHWGPAKVV